MKITVCRNCGKPVHTGPEDAPRCPYCGGAIPAEPAGDRAAAWESALAVRDFPRALRACESAIERAPSAAEPYWGRFLARNQCACDRELLEKGAPFAGDPDYLQAVHFARGEEKPCSISLAAARERAAGALSAALDRQERQEKRDTGVARVQRESLEELERLRETLNRDIAALDRTEAELCGLAADCCALLEAGKARISGLSEELGELQTQAQAAGEYTDEQAAAFVARLETSTAAARDELEALQTLRDSERFRSYEQAADRQKRLNEAVNRQLAEVRGINDRQNILLGRLAAIASKYEEARTQAAESGFSKAESLLGGERFRAALQSGVSGTRGEKG